MIRTLKAAILRFLGTRDAVAVEDEPRTGDFARKPEIVLLNGITLEGLSFHVQPAFAPVRHGLERSLDLRSGC